MPDDFSDIDKHPVARNISIEEQVPKVYIGGLVRDIASKESLDAIQAISEACHTVFMRLNYYPVHDR